MASITLVERPLLHDDVTVADYMYFTIIIYIILLSKSVTAGFVTLCNLYRAFVI